jgi:hypothetical protein
MDTYHTASFYCGDELLYAGKATYCNDANTYLENLVGLGVHAVVVNVLVVDAILLTTSDTKLHLEQAVDLSHALHVLDADLNVLLQVMTAERP